MFYVTCGNHTDLRTDGKISFDVCHKMAFLGQWLIPISVRLFDGNLTSTVLFASAVLRHNRKILMLLRFHSFLFCYV